MPMIFPCCSRIGARAYERETDAPSFLLPVPDLVPLRACLFPIPRRHQQPDRRAHHLLGAVAVDLLGPPVPARHKVLHVDAEDGVPGGFHQRGQPQDLLLRATPLRDVFREAEGADDVSVRAAHWHLGCRDPRYATIWPGLLFLQVNDGLTRADDGLLRVKGGLGMLGRGKSRNPFFRWPGRGPRRQRPSLATC